MLRLLRFFGVCSVLAPLSLLAVSCSSGEEPREKTSTVTEAITDGCTVDQLGAPCRPFTGGGSIGEECAGVCSLVTTFGGTAGIACQAVSAPDENDGKVCGKGAGEASDCTHTCSSGVCKAMFAPIGTACRPGLVIGGGGAAPSICDGHCDVLGACVAYLAAARPCPINKAGDCKFDFCDAKDSSSCISPILPAGTACATGSACTTGDKCDGAGVCSGTPLSCTTTNPCLTASCDPTTGCKTTPAPGTPACTFAADRCFVGVCGGGTCNKGEAKDCADADPCTTDGCTAATGCTHTAKCTGDACNIASCDATGTCSTTARDCADTDPCTADSCALPGGCLHTPIAGCGDAGVDTGTPDTGAIDSGLPDTGITDTGLRDSGRSDSGVTDTGVSESGIADSGVGSDSEIDSGIALDDTGATVDSGPSGDSRVSSDTAGEDGLAKSDSAPASDTGLGADAADLDASDDDPSLDLKSGCGCRTVGESNASGGARTPSSGASPFGALAVAGLGLLLARRRRRA